jgi:hypothetical protein
MATEIPQELLRQHWREGRGWGGLWCCRRLVELSGVQQAPTSSTRTGLVTLSSNQIFLVLMKTPRPAHRMKLYSIWKVNVQTFQLLRDLKITSY